MNSAKLITITPDAEKLAGYIARVSNPNNQDNENYAGLLRYCIKHNHWSVFEQSSMTLELRLHEHMEPSADSTVRSHIKNFPNGMLVPNSCLKIFLYLIFVGKTLKTDRILQMIWTF